MGGRLFVCELSEVSWLGLAKPANRTKQNNNPNREILKNIDIATCDQNEKFSKT